MPNYDTLHFDPPAPVTGVMLRDPQSGSTVSDIQLLLDTGADVTLLPHRAIDRLGVMPLPDQQSNLWVSMDARALRLW